MTTLTWDRHRGHASAYDVVTVGFNYRLDEIRAAMALVQLERLPAATVARRRLADRYAELLDEQEGLCVPFAARSDRGEAAHHLVVVVLPESVDREDVRAALTASGIQTSVHYPPVHTFTAYAGTSGRPLPHTESVGPRLLSLPLYPDLSDENLELVTDRLVGAVRASRPAASRA
jgi:dTDP-4-amino-4,6-dideoxygalactose transaminase